MTTSMSGSLKQVSESRGKKPKRKTIKLNCTSTTGPGLSGRPASTLVWRGKETKARRRSADEERGRGEQRTRRGAKETKNDRREERRRGNEARGGRTGQRQ